ncbi:GDYXXLXY domain-containing protein [Pontibacter sp. JH31]|uniref:GDYXXLXY domain-containing protein n=1 Tax=Pontibacter aquaedesilientis TaxID=2766980 RepID=A0ABR7XIG7_9BACT|nr:GDYXXLXY domain-containing protein [Pontibacter aquaedesilientis]MBD1398088.1 GDYXXLXY domain-containing protein [Pontibacter aquaedesilientis]
MKYNLKSIVVLVNLVAVLAFFNLSVVEKEEILADGQLVLLELAPVDPRSLMQGDYMVLSYAISQTQELDKLPSRGYAVVQLDSQNVAQLVRYQSGKEPLNPSELLLRYSKGRWALHLGAESFFFEEGQAETFEKAKYGGLRVDREGNSVLVGLYDENRNLLVRSKE